MKLENERETVMDQLINTMFEIGVSTYNDMEQLDLVSIAASHYWRVKDGQLTLADERRSILRQCKDNKSYVYFRLYKGFIYLFCSLLKN